MSLPVANLIRPSDLHGQENGKLDAALLMPVGGGQLHHLAARAFGALYVNAIHFTGMHLTATYGGWYRSYDEQVALFKRRYAVGGTGGGCKTWNGERWCKKSSNLATAATPGKSNHGWGLAVDTAYDSDLSDGVGSDDATYIKGHAGWPWLLENAHLFGFSWELQSEPWHIRYVAGDDLPAKVLEWEAFAASLTGDPEPPVIAPPGEVIPPPERPTGDTHMHWLDEVKQGSWNNTVTVLQTLLYSLGYSIQPDGVFGAQTDRTVRQFQERHGLKVDGRCGPKTWNALGTDGPMGGEVDRG